MQVVHPTALRDTEALRALAIQRDIVAPRLARQNMISRFAEIPGGRRRKNRPASENLVLELHRRRTRPVRLHFTAVGGQHKWDTQ